MEVAAGHRHHGPEWSEAENEARLGECYRAPGHGHNYRVEGPVALLR